MPKTEDKQQQRREKFESYNPYVGTEDFDVATALLALAYEVKQLQGAVRFARSSK